MPYTDRPPFACAFVLIVRVADLAVWHVGFKQVVISFHIDRKSEMAAILNGSEHYRYLRLVWLKFGILA